MNIQELRIPMNLQLFADGDGAGAAAGGNGGGAAGSGAGADGAGNDKPVAFDDFLKSGGNQAEFDRRVQQAITTAVTNAQSKWKALSDDKLSEAEKLAKMTKEEQAEYKVKKLEKEIADLNRKSAISDMSKTARKMLSDSGITIPDELLNMIVTTDAEGTKTAIDGFAKAFAAAVDSAVKEKIKGEPPRKGAGGAAPMTKEQIMAIRDPELRQKKMLENKELFNF